MYKKEWQPFGLPLYVLDILSCATGSCIQDSCHQSRCQHELLLARTCSLSTTQEDMPQRFCCMGGSTHLHKPRQLYEETLLQGCLLHRTRLI